MTVWLSTMFTQFSRHSMILMWKFGSLSLVHKLIFKERLMGIFVTNVCIKYKSVTINKLKDQLNLG